MGIFVASPFCMLSPPVHTHKHHPSPPPVGEHWKPSWLLRRASSELLGLRLLHDGDHVHRGLRWHHVHHDPRQGGPRVLPPGRTGKRRGPKKGAWRVLIVVVAAPSSSSISIVNVKHDKHEEQFDWRREATRKPRRSCQEAAWVWDLPGGVAVFMLWFFLFGLPPKIGVSMPFFSFSMFFSLKTVVTFPTLATCMFWAIGSVSISWWWPCPLWATETLSAPPQWAGSSRSSSWGWDWWVIAAFFLAWSRFSLCS